jgi:hypothetical protein
MDKYRTRQLVTIDVPDTPSHLIRALNDIRGPRVSTTSPPSILGGILSSNWVTGASVVNILSNVRDGPSVKFLHPFLDLVRICTNTNISIATGILWSGDVPVGGTLS